MALTFTTLGSDDFNRPDGAPGSNWDNSFPGNYSALTISSDEITNAASGASMMEWVAGVIPADQFVQATFKGAPSLPPSMELYLRISDSNPSANFVLDMHGDNDLWTIYDNSSSWFSTFSNPLKAGDVVKFAILGTTFYIYYNGSLIQQIEAPQHDPSGGGTTFVGTGVGFFSNGSFADDWSVGSVTATGFRRIINGNWQDLAGNPLALGYLTFRLNTDMETSGVQIAAGRLVTVPLDANGSISGTVLLAVNTESTTYDIRAYTAAGQFAWRNPVFTLPAGAGSYDFSA